MHTLNTRINTAILIFIALTGVAIVTMLATRAYGGPLDPPGAPSPTQPNLIYQPASCAGFPIVLSAPGSYKLASNITGCAAKDGDPDHERQHHARPCRVQRYRGARIARSGSRTWAGTVSSALPTGVMATWGGTGLNLDGSGASRVDNIIAAGNGINGMVLGGAARSAAAPYQAVGSNGVVLCLWRVEHDDHRLQRGLQWRLRNQCGRRDGCDCRGCSVGGKWARASTSGRSHGSLTTTCTTTVPQVSPPDTRA